MAKDNLLASAAYYLINLQLAPVTVMGYVTVIATMALRGRGSGVSLSAQGPLSARAAQHMLGVRHDEASHRLMKIMPGTSQLGMSMLSVPMMLGHRLTGFVPKTFRYPWEGDVTPQVFASARGTFFDDVIDRSLPRVTQLVILGAGFDTRAYRLPTGLTVRAFEVDTPKTQAVKRELLSRAGVDASRVTFVAADFETDDCLAKLIAAGFDASEPALFLWEGVIIYLDRAAVEATLRRIAGTAKGSLVAFDFYSDTALHSGALFWRYARAATKAAGEPIKYGVDSRPPLRDRVAELLASCGLTLAEARTFGDETGKRAWGGIAVGEVG